MNQITLTVFVNFNYSKNFPTSTPKALANFSKVVAVGLRLPLSISLIASTLS
jgi:hypothetical protein